MLFWRASACPTVIFKIKLVAAEVAVVAMPTTVQEPAARPAKVEVPATAPNATTVPEAVKAKVALPAI